MAHFAELDSYNYVLRTVVIANEDILDDDGNESEEVGIAFCRSLYGTNTNWKQTSYNGNTRKNYASVGGVYDPIRDAFIPPRPYLSWNLIEETCRWEPPVPYPGGPEWYVWDESTQSWVLEVTE